MNGVRSLQFLGISMAYGVADRAGTLYARTAEIDCTSPQVAQTNNNALKSGTKME